MTASLAYSGIWVFPPGRGRQLALVAEDGPVSQSLACTAAVELIGSV